MQGINATIKIVLGLVLAWWLGLDTVIRLLVVLMAIDILSGMIGAAITKTLSSNESYKGIAKKALVLLIVAAAEAISIYLGPDALPVNLGEIVAGFYCAHEGLSILENAIAAGLPVPRQLRDTLAKLAPEKIEYLGPVG